MKSLILSLFLLISPLAFAASVITVSVPDVTCAVCAQTITAVLGKNPAVNAVTVDVEKRVAVIKLRAGHTLSDDAIRADIKETGFTAGAIQR